MPGSAIAVPDSEALAALQAQQNEEFEGDRFTTPLLKIAQPLTKEVQDELVEPGEFFDSLTSESIGTQIEFIVAYYNRGRFAADRESGRGYASSDANIPDSWVDLVGEEFIGTPFSEYPDAEEVYKERANRKEIKWGSGPLVSTTYVFTGLAVIQPPEKSDDAPELRPLRLSLQRTNAKVAAKWRTLYRGQRNAAIWDRAYDLGTDRKQFTQGSAHLLTVRLGRATTPDERSAATELAFAVQGGRVSDNAAEDGASKPVEPPAKGGLAV